MEAIEIAISILSAFLVGIVWRYLSLAEKRRDERHSELISTQKAHNDRLDNIIDSIQKEMKGMREEMQVEFRKRDIQISDNRHQIKNITANMMMIMAKEYPEFAKVLEKFMDNR